MTKRRVGRTSLHVSEIGFGCGGNAGLMVKGTPEEQREAIATALEVGIDYFDTAPVYGDTASERNLGAALSALDARPIVATKVALELAELDDIAGAVVRSVEASLERLRRESVEIVHLHNRVGSRRSARSDVGVGAMLTVDDVLGRNGVVAGLERLRARGLVRYFGCCAYGGEMAQLRVVLDSGAFDTLLVHYSIVNRTAWAPGTGGDRDYEGIGAYAASRGMGSSALRILEGGGLTAERHAHARGPSAEERAATLQRARTLVGDSHDFVSAAMRFALDNPALSTVLVGFSDARQVLEAAEIARDRHITSRAAP
jgi:L-glyceraldehyde 3-phosphate reductase